jgi:hypothetical protein
MGRLMKGASGKGTWFTYSVANKAAQKRYCELCVFGRGKHMQGCPVAQAELLRGLAQSVDTSKKRKP